MAKSPQIINDYRNKGYSEQEVIKTTSDFVTDKIRVV